jgi:hypothetical protein
LLPEIASNSNLAPVVDGLLGDVFGTLPKDVTEIVHLGKVSLQSGRIVCRLHIFRTGPGSGEAFLAPAEAIDDETRREVKMREKEITAKMLNETLDDCHIHGNHDETDS